MQEQRLSPHTQSLRKRFPDKSLLLMRSLLLSTCVLFLFGFWSLGACSPNASTERLEAVIADARSPEENLPEPTVAEVPPEKSGSQGPQMLVGHKLWKVVEGKEDPYDGICSKAKACDSKGLGYEFFGGEDTFEIRTGLCNCVTIRQPSLVSIRKGGTIQVRIWHFKLTAPAPGKAYLSLSFGQDKVWEGSVLIPSKSGLLAPDWKSKKAYPAGTPVFFHLHNHGENFWSIIELSAD